MKTLLSKISVWHFLAIGIVYFMALRVDIMDIDASQYAEISREMTQNGSYLKLYDHGKNYLDKPPFLFWVSSASIGIFGNNNIGYKLPSVLFAFLALWGTYRLTRLLYDEKTAKIAALILGCSQAFFLMTNDVRCDTILTAWVALSLWLLKEWDIQRKIKYLLLGSAAIGFGMMTKGPIALMVPLFAFGSDWVLKRKWDRLLDPRYILSLITIALVLLPMSIGLYLQYDGDPSAVDENGHHISGLRFFYWTQSFGRITGESKWNNGTGPEFLYQNMLWSFLPWILILTVAVVIRIAGIIRQRFRLQEGQEWLSTGGFLLTYLALGSSKYQLPHYIFVAFPLAAIMTASFFRDYVDENKYAKVARILFPVQYVVLFILIVAALMIAVYVFPGGLPPVVLWSVLFILLAWYFLRYKEKDKVVMVSFAAMIFINIFLTNYLYTPLLRYQMGSQIGQYLKSNNIPNDKFFVYKTDNFVNSIDYYAGYTCTYSADTLLAAKGDYVLVEQGGLDEIKNRKKIPFHLVHQGERFKVSELTGTFLNPSTRKEAVTPYFLLLLD